MFSFTNIQDYQIALKNNQTTCLDAVTHYLSAIRQKAGLNAVIHVFEDEAIEKAKDLDAQRAAGKPLGKLHGVVCTIKDVILYKDHPVSAASNMLKGVIAPYHATAIEKLLQEDAIIIGSVNCDEFAMGSSNENSFYGPAKNEIDTTIV